MRLIELEVGSWFRSPRWSDNAVGELVVEPKAEHGLAMIHVHRQYGAGAVSRAMRSRLATVKEMEAVDWERCERPAWVALIGVGGSGGS